MMFCFFEQFDQTSRYWDFPWIQLFNFEMKQREKERERERERERAEEREKK
jgi:hypothetical protein